jgi:tricorn protease interacting factor F2/3
LEVKTYDLDLDVDFARASLGGVVRIVLQGTKGRLALDATQMKIDAVKVNGSPAAFKHDEAKGVLSIQGVPSRRSTVAVKFSKAVSDEVIFGLYKAKYGKDYFLATDFEPAEARTTFPCIDHPAYKAVFRLKITTEKGLKVISNTTVKSKKAVKGGRVKFTFNPTPKMSTYLLFFSIGKYEEIKSKKNGKEVIFAARPKESENGRFVMGVAHDALRDYQRYFGILYPLKKLHIVALPEYHTGAMENWGAIASREGYVLFDKNAGVFDMRYGALVVAHEIGHQWFGDLVTMKWWDDLWLNESFATFVEFKMIDRLHPDWDVWSIFLRTQAFRSQNMDALSTTHPIQVHVRSPKESSQTFDAISYGKGASVLRMIEAYLGETPFRKGVSSYLKRFSYSNATGQDLWKSIEKASGQPVSRMMGAWIKKPGFPLVRVSHRDGKLSFTQGRFQLNGEEPEDVWPIPLTLELNGRRKNVIFDKKTMSIEAPSLDTLNVNVGHNGFYSVLCEPQIYAKVASNFEKLSSYDKGGLISDLFLFLQAGKIEPQTYFKFVALCENAGDPLLVETIADQLSLLNAIAGESRLVHEAAVAFTTAQVRRLGLIPRPGEDKGQSIVREAVTTLLARLDTEHTPHLARFFADFDHLDPNLMQAAAIAYARESGPGVFDSMVSRVKSETNEGTREKLYLALTSFKDGALVRKALDLSISGQVSRSDSGYVFAVSAMNPDAREAVWSWIQANYDKMWDLYAGSQQFLIYMEVVVPRVAVGKLEEVSRFLSGDRMDKGGMAYRRLLESLEIRSRVRERLLASG